MFRVWGFGADIFGLPVAWTLAPGSLQPAYRFHAIRIMRLTLKSTPSSTIPVAVSMQTTRSNWRDFGAHLNEFGSHVRAGKDSLQSGAAGNWTLPRSGVGWKDLQPGLQPKRVQKKRQTNLQGPCKETFQIQITMRSSLSS